MTDLKGQRRLAAQILKIGQNRVWISPEHMTDVEGAITREEVRKLIHEKVIVSLPVKGVSRSRAKSIRGKKKLGRRSGPGSVTGAGYAKVTQKEAWMIRIRALRRRLRELKASRIITDATYTQYYRMAGSGRFESMAELERNLKEHELWRKR
jgi:large subunit ribosomal protein L19e